MAWLQMASLAVSAYSALSSGGKSNAMSAKQEALIGEQLTSARRVNGVADEQFNLYDQYSPDVYDSIFGTIGDGPQYDRAMTEASTNVNQAFDNQDAASKRNMQRYGVDPSSGRFGAEVRRNGLSRSLALVQNQNKAKRDADDQQWARLMTGADISQGFMNNGNNASRTAMSGLNSAGKQYGSAADRYSKASGSSAQTAGYLLSKLDGASGGDSGGNSGGNGLYGAGSANGLSNADGSNYYDSDNDFYAN